MCMCVELVYTHTSSKHLSVQRLHFKRRRKRPVCFISDSFPDVLVRESIMVSFNKKKCLGVSPVAGQANHMSGFAICSSSNPVLADAASRQAQAWTLLGRA